MRWPLLDRKGYAQNSRSGAEPAAWRFFVVENTEDGRYMEHETERQSVRVGESEPIRARHI
jgi:hypothetical protein